MDSELIISEVLINVIPMCNCVCDAVVQFEVCIQNRYKLNKKYRKVRPLQSNPDDVDTSLDTKTLAMQAKVRQSYMYIYYIYFISQECSNTNTINQDTHTQTHKQLSY